MQVAKLSHANYRVPLLFCLLGIILTISFSEVYAQGTWSTKTSMPTARAFAAGGVMSDSFYVAGGSPPTGFSASVVEAYNPLTDSWVTKAPMILGGRLGAGAGVIGTNFYVVGGNDGVSGDTRTLQVYDSIHDIWTIANSIPTPDVMDSPASAVVGGILYILGGQIPACHSLDSVWAYDPSIDSWTLKTPMPLARSGGAAGVINGKIYVIGGNSQAFCGDPQNQLPTSVDVYDPATDTWSTAAPIPNPRQTHSVAVINGLLYVMGGNGPSGDLDPTVIAYDPTTNSWTEVAPIPTPRQVMAVGVIGNTAYAAGGLSNHAGTVHATVEAFTPSPSVPMLTALGPAAVWVGLKNSDDVGIKFDLLAEVYKDSTLIGSGQVNSVPGGSSGFNNAKLDSIPLNLSAPTPFPGGSTLALKLYVRNACTGSGKNSGTARLWYNDAAANSQFGATIETAQTYFLVDGFALSNQQGPGPKKNIDVAAGSKCSSFKSFGTWSFPP
ncbi:MAG TPA: kelch repeat-containing protein [Candidatus Binatia bacterium]